LERLHELWEWLINKNRTDAATVDAAIPVDLDRQASATGEGEVLT
jgi:hypothetical protein